MSTASSYHRRWASAGAPSSSAASRSVTSSIEPHTYGTSWNSVRWNKPLGEHVHSSRYAAAVESTSKGSIGYSLPLSNRYNSQPAPKRIETGNLGPSVLERTSRFGGSVLSSTRDSNQSFSRTPLKRASWAPESTIRRSSLAASYLSPRAALDESTSSAKEYSSPRFSSIERANRTSSTPSRIYDVYSRRSVLSPTPPGTSTFDRTITASHDRTSAPSTTPKAERPWRQRLADAARLRSVHGDEIGGALSSTIAASRARRESISNNHQSEDELQSSLNALKSLVDSTATADDVRLQRTTPSRFRRSTRQSSADIPVTIGENSAIKDIAAKYAPMSSSYSSPRREALRTREPYMSRSYSPIRSKDPFFSQSSSRYNSLSRDLSPRTWGLSRQSSNETVDMPPRSITSRLPKSATILESSRESSARRKLSRSERTARHSSQQRSETREDDSESSSGAESRAESRERRLRRKKSRKKASHASATPEGCISPSTTAEKKTVDASSASKLSEGASVTKSFDSATILNSADTKESASISTASSPVPPKRYSANLNAAGTSKTPDATKISKSPEPVRSSKTCDAPAASKAAKASVVKSSDTAKILKPSSAADAEKVFDSKVLKSSNAVVPSVGSDTSPVSKISATSDLRPSDSAKLSNTSDVFSKASDAIPSLRAPDTATISTPLNGSVDLKFPNEAVNSKPCDISTPAKATAPAVTKPSGNTVDSKPSDSLSIVKPFDEKIATKSSENAGDRRGSKAAQVPSKGKESEKETVRDAVFTERDNFAVRPPASPEELNESNKTFSDVSTNANVVEDKVLSRPKEDSKLVKKLETILKASEMGQDESKLNKGEKSEKIQAVPDSPKPKKKLFSFARKKKSSEADEKEKPKKDAKKQNGEKKKHSKAQKGASDAKAPFAELICIAVKPPTPPSDLNDMESTKVEPEQQPADREKQPLTLSDLTNCVLPEESQNEPPLVAPAADEQPLEGTANSYSAVAHFTPGKRKKSPAPVPGTWSGPMQEMNISHNKHLHKEGVPASSSVVTILKAFSFAELPPLKIRIPKKVFNKISVNATLRMHLAIEEVAVKKAIKCGEFVSAQFRLPKKRRSVAATSSVAIALQCTSSHDERKHHTLKAKSRLKEIVGLRTKESTSSATGVKEDISKEGEMSSATQTISVPIAFRNYYRCRRRVRAAPAQRQSMPSLSALISEQTEIIEAEKKRLSDAALELEANWSTHHGALKEKSESLASIVLDQLRNSDEPPMWRRSSQRESSSDVDDVIVLPDRSILEEYVRRRKNRPERLHSEPPILEFEDSRDSPCLSTASELIPACAVRVLEPARNVPFITAPSRVRVDSVQDNRMTHPRDKNLLDASPSGHHTPSTSSHSFNNGLLNGKPRASSLSKPSIVFEQPVTPFEERMQQQALLLRKSSVASNISAFSDGDAPSSETPTLDVTMQLPANGRTRLPSADRASVTSGAPITCGFEAAAAAASLPRHERYAAHIPLNRSDNNGRNSAASVDSNKSTTLETASKKLDQMIDQARFRHHRHRSKFKEAIDYLDQIFEDLKKECDTPEDTSRPSRPVPITPQKLNDKPGFKSVSASSHRLNSQPKSSRQPPPNTSAPQFSTCAPQFARVPAPAPAKPKASLGVPDKANSFEQTSEDVDVSETIVLPSPERKLRGDRLDFTRKWLAGDIKSWAHAPPKADLLLGGLEEEPDFDERSIGSCSAEVAAINSIDRKKKIRETSELQNVPPPVKPIRQNNSACKYDSSQVPPPVPIKPQPVRPRPVYGVSAPSNNNFNSFPQPFRDLNTRNHSQELQVSSGSFPVKRVSSQSQLVDKRRAADTLSWRATSQDAYNTLSSVRSEDAMLGRMNGAFAQYNPASSSARGSMNNLNEQPTTGLRQSFIASQHPLSGAQQPLSVGHQHSPHLQQPLPLVQQRPMHSQQPDALLAIDALVAELELNTDEATVAEKRRSFPTAFESTVPNRTFEYEQPISSKRLSNGKAIGNSSVERGAKRSLQKASFDDMANMLHNVAGDMTASNENKFRRHDQFSSNTSTGTAVLSPFETINQERLNPSKVEAIQSMFENKQGAPTWRRNVHPPRHSNKEEDTYYEISELSASKKEPSPPFAKVSTKSLSPSAPNTRCVVQPKNAASIAQHEFVPAFPVTQPPPHPPGSANSSQTGGYYSSGSSLGAPSSYGASHHQSSLPRSSGRRGSLIGKQSVSSRAASFEDEDDGFYDNIQAEERRFSRGSELDSASLSSHRLPPNAKGTIRLGQFFRKIGASKPPHSAASLISLNKVAGENITGHPPLMKSNSLSIEPWNAQVIRAGASTQEHATSDKRAGLGQRLKNSLFGSKKRLN